MSLFDKLFKKRKLKKELEAKKEQEELAREKRHKEWSLDVAAKRGDLATVKSLLEQGVDINETTALIDAVIYNHFEIVEILLQHGADVNKKDEFGETAICRAIDSGCGEKDIKILELLLKNGANPNDKYISMDSFPEGPHDPLILHAARYGYLEKVKMLIDYGAKVDAKDEELTTALQAAVCRGQLDVAKFLLDNGADVNSKNIYGNSPLILACISYMDTIEMIELLLNAGADINTINIHGNNALIELLFCADMDTDVQNLWERTKTIECVLKDAKLLLEKGIDVNIINEEGKTALDYAFGGIEDILKQYGAINGVLAGEESENEIEDSIKK